jgi:methylenetetrahydrofolate dehydrogenase (NADP+)/methenyltetrahydrofolate cyclohydrolase
MPNARLIAGAPVAARVDAETRDLVASGRARGAPPPRVVALSGSSERSVLAYLESLARKAAELGLAFDTSILPEESTGAALARVEALNRDPEITGILVQLPLPDVVDARAVQEAIDPEKDVEGVTPANLGRLALGRPRLAPCTALAVMEAVAESGLPLRGADAVVIGKSEIVGKPIALLLLDRFATVTVCHIATRGLEAIAARADILVSATGKAHLVGREHVKPGALVVDVGYARIPDAPDAAGKPRYRVVGDVRQEEVAPVAAMLTPVPGGVGPITVSMLFRNAAGAALPDWRPRLPVDAR